jgi:hypothetical protein
MSTTHQAPKSRHSTRQLCRGLRTIFVVLSLLAPAGRGNADCTDHSILPYRWCSSLDIPVWWGDGLRSACNGSGSEAVECERWRAAVRAVMQEFNPGAVIELDTAPFLFEAGLWDGITKTGIVVSLDHLGLQDCTPGQAFDEHMGHMHPNLFPPTGAPLGSLQFAEVVFNLDAPWDLPAFHRTTVARHEFMHALGVGHATGGNCLMNPSLACGVTKTIDESAWAGLRCMYGDPFGSCTGSIAIDVLSTTGFNVVFATGICGCNSGGCQVPKAAQPVALTYEFALSESGGPYTVFASVDESNLVNHEYAHEFTQSYQSAMVRLRALNGTSLVGEAFTLYPITIGATSTALPPAVATQQPLRLLSSPNPFASETVLSFALTIDQMVEIVVYDTAGRRVATVHSGRLGPGQHEIAWNGRLDNGAPAASGIYHCVVRTENSITTKTLAKVR